MRRSRQPARRVPSIPHVIPWRPRLVAPQKPQNSNVLTSTAEKPTGELRAKFRGHRHRTSALTNATSTALSLRNGAPLKGRALVREHYTSEGAYTVSQLVQCSLNGATPLRNKPKRGPHSNHTPGHDRYRALHPLRGNAPDQNGCIAYRSGALPTYRVHCTHSQAQPQRASGSPQPTPRHRPHIHQFRT